MTRESLHSAATSPARSLQIAVLCAVLCAYLWACFAPFKWNSPLYHWVNGVERTVTNGFEFTTPGFVVLEHALDNAAAFDELVVSFTATARSCAQQGPARIVSFSNSIVARNFTVGQEGCDLQVRVLRKDSDANGVPAFVVPGVFNASNVIAGDTTRDSTAASVRVALHLTPDQIRIVIDGTQRLSRPVQLTGWHFDYPLLLGNEVGRERPWLGRLEDVNVSVDGATIADGDSPWQVLTTGWKPKDDLYKRYGLIPFENILDPPAYADRSLVQRQRLDVPLNVLGFIPFGVMLAWLSVGATRALIWSLLFSLGIELVQLALVGRFSSITDLGLNGLGGWLGAVLGGHSLRRLDGLVQV